MKIAGIGSQDNTATRENEDGRHSVDHMTQASADGSIRVLLVGPDIQ